MGQNFPAIKPLRLRKFLFLAQSLQYAVGPKRKRRRISQEYTKIFFGESLRDSVKPVYLWRCKFVDLYKQATKFGIWNKNLVVVLETLELWHQQKLFVFSPSFWKIKGRNQTCSGKVQMDWNLRNFFTHPFTSLSPWSFDIYVHSHPTLQGTPFLILLLSSSGFCKTGVLMKM